MSEHLLPSDGAGTSRLVAPLPGVMPPLPAFLRGGETALCIDSDAGMRDVMREALAGLEVEFAFAAYEAVRTINARAFDLYVMDYWLTDWSGPSLCRAIRKADPHVPICFCTNAVQPDKRARADRAGASTFFAKPPDAQLMQEEIAQLMRLRSRRNQEAREAAVAVIEQTLAQRIAILPEGRVNVRVAQSVKRVALNKAREAFLAAGGTRASFERSWEVLWWGTLEPYAE